jgi:hypothetical protein
MMIIQTFGYSSWVKIWRDPTRGTQTSQANQRKLGQREREFQNIEGVDSLDVNVFGRRHLSLYRPVLPSFLVLRGLGMRYSIGANSGELGSQLGMIWILPRVI